MQFLIAVCVKILTWLLELGGRFVYEKINEFLDKQKQEQREKENKKKYEDAKKHGRKDEILEKEKDIFNG
jgi:hypothetical protein